MATTNAHEGSLSVTMSATTTFSGDTEGGRVRKLAAAINFAAAGGDAPTISGCLRGCVEWDGTALDIALAHATDPFGTGGDSEYHDGFTPSGKRIKAVCFKNVGSVDITITRKAVTGCPIFNAAGDAITLQPGAVFAMSWETGTAVITSGSNDVLTLEAADDAELDVMVDYGP